MKCRDCPADAVEVKLTIPKSLSPFDTSGPVEMVGIMDHLCRFCWNRIYTRQDPPRYMRP